MENIYSEKKQPQACRLAKASKKTVDFLLLYSQSLDVVTYKEHTFERHLN